MNYPHYLNNIHNAWHMVKVNVRPLFKKEPIPEPGFFPHFTFECVVCIVILCIYGIIIRVLNKSRGEQDRYLRPNTLHLKERKKVIKEENPNKWRTRDFINDIPLGLRIKPSAEHIKRTKSYMERLLKLTPSEFVRQDKENRRRKNDYVKSLTSLYLNVTSNLFSEEELRQQIEATKENCMLSQTTRDVMKYIDSSRISDSLIDLLTDIVENDKDTRVPPHLLGDLTAFLYDIGNLQEKLLFEKGQETTPPLLLPSSATDPSNANKE